MTKVVLISQFSLPYPKIGSWTTLYANYIKNEHQIDAVICPKPNREFDGIEYGYVSRTAYVKLYDAVYGKSYLEYLLPLKRILKKEDKAVIQVIDNFGLIAKLGQFLRKHDMWKNCTVQFFYHGFSPIYNNFYGNKFFQHVDELILLTHASYRNFIDYYNVLPCKVSILSNGVDTTRFRPLSSDEKSEQQRQLGIEGKIVFIWCSQNRRKKGLDLVLEAWQQVYRQRTDIVLLVVGAKRNENIGGVIFVGPIPNDELPYYYQCADAYLFPTLCHEGFGMSLIEAMHSGCQPIASSIGGVPEVLDGGKYGILVKNPHFVDEWVDAINNYLEKNYVGTPFPNDRYTTLQWNRDMNKIISAAKMNLEATQ